MTAKRPPKKAPAKAGAERSQTFIEWKRDNGVWNLLQRRPLELGEVEQKLIDGAIAAGLHGVTRGRSSSALDLLMIAEGYLRAGAVMPEPLRVWLADRLEELSSHDVPFGVPMIRRKRGEKSADEWAEQYVIAAFYNQLLERGEKHEVAWRETVAALEFLHGSLTESKIENYWRKHFPKSRN